MSAIDLTTAQEHLAAWLAADKALASGGASYSIGNRALTRADGDLIAANIARWRAEVDRLTAIAAGNSGGGVMTASWS